MKVGNQVNKIILVTLKLTCVELHGTQLQLTVCFLLLTDCKGDQCQHKTASTWVCCSDCGSWMHCVCAGVK